MLFRSFPNPFDSQTTISFSKEQTNTEIKITDLLGKEIKDMTFSGKQVVINRDEMKDGIYFVQIIDQNRNIVNSKLVIQ